MSPPRRKLWFPWLAIAFNMAAAVGCGILIALASGTAAALLAAAGIAFFGLAALGFALMLRLRDTASGQG